MEIKMTIIYENADGLIQASVAELPGAISLGADVEEAWRNLDEAIEMVLEGNRLLASRAKLNRRTARWLSTFKLKRRHSVKMRPVLCASAIRMFCWK
jgi:predicted RNase H-like HicB family nuclease